ncbi:MAG: hypothetical protein HQL58_07225 [Magnetococcales bacterium]|nr:hypothetical protein [Magnetococcales bacterium]
MGHPRTLQPDIDHDGTATVLLAALPQPVMALHGLATDRGELEILFWNSSCEQLSGVAAADIHHTATLTRLFGDQAWSSDAIIDRTWHCRNGMVRTLRWQRFSLPWQDDRVWYVGQDITESRRIEEQLRIMIGYDPGHTENPVT